MQGAGDRDYATMWQNYKKRFGKSYATMDDDLHAFTIWRRNIGFVLEANKDLSLQHWVSKAWTNIRTSTLNLLPNSAP